MKNKSKICTDTNNIGGAGVLLFEEDNVILFREKKEGVYTEPGGSFDEKKHCTIESTAIEELFEETCALFKSTKIQTKKNFFELHFKEKKSYRVYTLDIPYITSLRRDYTCNLNRLNDINANKIFLETNNVTRVNVGVLRNAILNIGKKKHDDLNKKHEVYVVDEYGNQITLKRRTVRVLRKWFLLNKNVVPKKIKKVRVFKSCKMIKYKL
ncbi:MAG: hypothetical protein JSR17_01090 [Proteobacteria bacterium]|nr:hypothetical protein [Pseudomonadota bacterium]